MKAVKLTSPINPNNYEREKQPEQPYQNPFKNNVKRKYS